MVRLDRLGALITAAIIAAGWNPDAHGQSASSSGGASSSGTAASGHRSQGDPTQIPAAVSSGWNWYRPYVIVQATPMGVYSTVHVPFGAIPAGVPVYVPQPSMGPAAPAPPPGLIRPVKLDRATIRVKKADRERAEQLTTFGDRMFRIGNYKRAEERYQQAIHANPYSAAPRLRLAQVALVREQYPLAADLLREAETAQPGWIVTARDVQSLYAEPADFARHVAKLEAHLHRKPEDRDAWLVLGAQWFLSRREAKAADVFLRLDEPRRKPDVALAAFLDAARLRKTEPPAPDPGKDSSQPLSP
ncbi:tetratricopeptide repeat protein [Paludisphaera mucosa]|uniref:Tetratricopeptide repeat protein n=1 Tax=Paludisphaera mucosa TaxID=3030827 RepID=A0ABT6FHB8_9BACT|nr:tetratricopeptide repeat protein [Paludisphaera mucosa]MDG3006978.1 tetratricopeptide repeat protein [Paludisphaera mucosa]